MKRLQRGFIFLLLTTLIVTPPLLIGYLHLAQADSAPDNQTASEEYEAAARLLFWREDLAEKAGVAALANQDAPRAIRMLTKASDLGALTPKGHFSLSKAYLMNGETDLALSEWENLFDKKQETGNISPLLAREYHSRKQFADEMRVLRQWLDFEPKNPEASERLGLLFAASAAPKAIPLLETAGAASPDATSRLEKLLSALQNPSADPAYRLVLCGQALANLGEWRLAEQAFASAAQINPNYAQAWAWLGLARQQNQTTGGQTALENAVKLEGNSAPLRAMLGAFWLKAGQPQKAKAEFERAAQLEPDNPAWWEGLAEAQSETDLPAALAAYLQAIKLAPEKAESWSALATFCVENNVYLEDYGLNAALKATTLDPGNPVYLDLLGRARMGLGQVAAAETLFRQALTADKPNRADIYHFHLGLLYLQTGQPVPAKAEFEQTVRINPQGASGQQAKKLLERYFP